MSFEGDNMEDAERGAEAVVGRLRRDSEVVKYVDFRCQGVLQPCPFE